MRFNPERLLGTVLLLALAPLVSATTRYVNGVSGSDSNNCLSTTTACKTIGHAISLASSGDTIRVAGATYNENLTIGLSLSIVGASAATTIIDGERIATVVTISSSAAHVTLSNLTIRNGLAVPVGGGGGVHNNGALTINNSTISGNNGTFVRRCPRPYRCPSEGGGIFNVGTMVIANSTISGNDASSYCGLGNCPAEGGGIFNAGTLTISNSTLNENTAQNSLGSGGGIYNSGGATVRINNSTISDNTAYGGGGVFNEGSMALQNTIVANNPKGGNCFGTASSKGYNLSSDGTCSLNGPGDMQNIDPLLGPLQNNGGPTQTMALLPGSPAIDAGNPSGCTDGNGNLLKTDQRGMPRPDKEDSGGCDMGAYESQSD